MTALKNLAHVETPLVFVDVETTGFNPATGHRVVEIGLVRYERGREERRWWSLVNPQRPIGEGASGVHGITDEMVIDAPRYRDLVSEIISHTYGAVLVAHNAAFDARFLKTEQAILRYTLPAPPRHNPYPGRWLCTLKLSRAAFSFRHNGLDDLCRSLNIRRDRVHRALDDALASAQVLDLVVQVIASQEQAEHGVFSLPGLPDLFDLQGGPVQVDLERPTQHPAIERAIKEREPLLVKYGGTDENRTIFPLYMTARSGTSYVIARCRRGGDPLCFRLDRFEDVQPMTADPDYWFPAAT